MLSYADALNLIDSNVEPLEATPLALDRIGSAATAEPVTSRLDVPAFANAAMDGFALRAAETSDATADAPLRLAVTGIVAAGDAPADAPPRGAAIEIMTGAPMPRDCDTVIPIERVE
ncbi:MAG: molybdopterin molybdenumtransferase MoeA, partial [Gammaproteobacteria bacterium]